MPRKAKGKDEESEEYKTFATFTKRILSVPKAEIDRREAEEQAAKDAAKVRVNIENEPNSSP